MTHFGHSQLHSVPSTTALIRTTCISTSIGQLIRTSLLHLESCCVFNTSKCRELSSGCAFWGKEPLGKCIHLYRRVEFKPGLIIAFKYRGKVPRLSHGGHPPHQLSPQVPSTTVPYLPTGTTALAPRISTVNCKETQPHIKKGLSSRRRLML